jgi:mutator protein MutT
MDDRLRDRVLANMAAHERRAHASEGLRRAAVALVLMPDEKGRPTFILTRRASKLRDHPGQWAFPGGRVDAGETIERAAMRELREEVGLELAPESILGRLDDYPTRSGFVITPVVAWAGDHERLAANPDEVAKIYHVPLRALANRRIPQLKTIPQSERPVISIPILGTNIHAPTAAVMYQLREVALLGRRTRVDHFEQPVWAWK